jgi:DNA-directed RNA polymerase specialized sigma24 family protein
MTPADPFVDLLRRVRGGDADAAEALWRRFEPLLRRELRLRLRDPRLRRRFDESDVCQSVMASFFVRAAAGQFDLNSTEQLQHLLVRMGRNKLATHARRHAAECRDVGRAEPLPAGEAPLVSPEPGPAQKVAWRELLQQFRGRLDPEERQLADLRADGVAWADIAAQLGGTADGRRVQLSRAVARVSAELGLIEEGED